MNFNLVFADNGIYIERRKLLSNRQKLTCHVLNAFERGKELEAILSLMKIEGEICASFADDRLHRRRRLFLAALLRGPILQSFDYDCYSEVDLLGRRYDTSNCGGDRFEMWVVPKDCSLEAVLTDSPRVAEALREEGIRVILLSDVEVLREEEPEEWFGWEEEWSDDGHLYYSWKRSESTIWD